MNKANESLNVWANSLPSGSWCSTKDSNIKFEEQKSKITFVNKSKKSCLKVDVDGGVIPSNTRSARCDKLLVEKSAPLFCFVELKGGDIEHAIEQLEASLKNPKLNPECSQRKLAFVVGKNHFPASSPLIQKGMKKNQFPERKTDCCEYARIVFAVNLRLWQEDNTVWGDRGGLLCLLKFSK